MQECFVQVWSGGKREWRRQAGGDREKRAGGGRCMQPASSSVVKPQRHRGSISKVHARFLQHWFNYSTELSHSKWFCYSSLLIHQTTFSDERRASLRSLLLPLHLAPPTPMPPPQDPDQPKRAKRVYRACVACRTVRPTDPPPPLPCASLHWHAPSGIVRISDSMPTAGFKRLGISWLKVNSIHYILHGDPPSRFQCIKLARPRSWSSPNTLSVLVRRGTTPRQ